MFVGFLRTDVWCKEVIAVSKNSQTHRFRRPTVTVTVVVSNVTVVGGGMGGESSGKKTSKTVKNRLSGDILIGRGIRRRDISCDVS